MSIFWYSKDKEKEGKNSTTTNTTTKENLIPTGLSSSRTSRVSKDVDIEIDNLSIRNDVLLEIATFLARRWSDRDDATVIISREQKTATNIEKRKITLPELDYFYGNLFQKYRQWRTLLWYESMRLKYSFKIYDTDIAFGYIFNIIETKRVEILGLNEWRGMINEVIFYEALTGNNKPMLNSLHGKTKIIEAFSQFFLTGFIKGEIFGGENERIQKASEYAKEMIKDYIKNYKKSDKNKNKVNYSFGDPATDQKWLENETRQVIKILQIDSLMSIPPIPLMMPKSKFGISMTREEILDQIEKIVKLKTKDIEIEKVKKDIEQGKEIREEFKVIVKESKKSDNKGYETIENLAITIPDNDLDVDENKIYDYNLINKVKTALKEWKSGWKENYDDQGEELEVENYIERHQKVFINDKKVSINIKISILLDLSSSIEDNEIEYKKAAVALCEGLEYLGIKFSVYAFNTESRSIKCWIIKPQGVRWGSIYAKRLMKVKPLGGTPLAEVYGILQPTISSFKPDIFVTLTDGEPSDMNAVRKTVLAYKRYGIKMIAIGLGSDVNDAVGIGHNLKYLDYEKALSLSKKRLQDLPKKVLGLLATE
ncbi:MAG: vWA domain-containing protein [Candidatus Nitrosocosmicus sp.]